MDYNSFTKTLCDIPGDNNASQWHGLLCGLICAGRPINPVVWFDAAMTFTGGVGVMSHEVGTLLNAVCESARRQLDSPLIEFDLMLPEEEDLSLRAEALKEWCDAFLYGLSAGGLDKNVEMSVEALEFLQDLTEFCKISHDDTETEEDEFYFVELTEYIRTGVLLLYDEFNAGVSSGQPIH